MKRGNKKMASYLILIFYILCTAFGMVLIRKGGIQSSAGISEGRITLNIEPAFLIGLVLYAVSFLLWLYILQLFPLTYISPVAYGLVYVLVCLLSSLLLGEAVPPRAICGGVMIIAGIILAGIRHP
ncbi:MAG: hypothetical protein II837_06755 [Treponema sp.]|nr:hypothetical protein [Treponema sp.]